MKLLMNNLLNSSKELTVFGVISLNHTRASPLRVVGKILYIIPFGTPWRCIVVLKVAMWSHGSRIPSYESNEGILNFEGKGWLLMEVMKGESIRWTKSSTWFVHSPHHLIHLLFQVWHPTRSCSPWTVLTFNIFSFSNFLTLSLPFHIPFMTLPSVKTSVIHLLGTYVTILCNWLIFWQNALNLYLGRSKMCLILQENLFQDQMLKPCKFVQDSSWKVPVIKAR